MRGEAAGEEGLDLPRGATRPVLPLSSLTTDRGQLYGDLGLEGEERQELQRLRRENKQLRVEREILSKAATWFAREADSKPSRSSNS